MTHYNHLCRHCGRAFGEHAGPYNPHVKHLACPLGKFPNWPSGHMAEGRAGDLYDERIRKFWLRSKTCFAPR